MKITGHSAESIFDSIRDGIGKGRLPAGSVLPPVRELAEQLGVNRNTVAAAYKRLDAAGTASTAGRRGTVVRGLPPTLAREGSTPGWPCRTSPVATRTRACCRTCARRRQRRVCTA
ncbi:GntR family transcriptional regulator [Stenotrophomonas sp. CD2]|nr:GntR family transcriptional regulator [Stenotrophomonas sp. CD2]